MFFYKIILCQRNGWHLVVEEERQTYGLEEMDGDERLALGYCTNLSDFMHVVLCKKGNYLVENNRFCTGATGPMLDRNYGYAVVHMVGAWL